MDENFVALCEAKGVNIDLLKAAIDDFTLDPAPFTPEQWDVILCAFQVGSGM